jgi:hypothetical protein
MPRLVMLIFIHYLVVWVTSDGKYYGDPTNTMLSYFLRPSVGSSKNNRDGSYNNNTPSTHNDSNNTASYTNTNNRLIIIITLLIVLVLAFVLLRILLDKAM